jgi:ATP-dependent protease ClpP protease subunit
MLNSMFAAIVLITSFLNPSQAIYAAQDPVMTKILPTTVLIMGNIHKVSHIEREFDTTLYYQFDKEMSDTLTLPGARIILINSPGGSIEVGKMMLKLLKAEQSRGVKEICVVEHAAHSMAFNFLSFCDVRLAVKGSFSVVHKVAIDGGIDDLPGRHTAAWFRKVADDMDQMDEEYRQKNSKVMHMSLKDYDMFADNETPWSATTLLLMGYFQGFAVIK